MRKIIYKTFIALSGIIISFFIYKFFQEKEVNYHLFKTIPLKYRSGTILTHEFFYEQKELLYPKRIKIYLLNKSDSVRLKELELDFSKNYYLLSFGIRIKRIVHSPYISFKDGSSLRKTPTEIEFVDSIKCDSLYIYQINEKKKYRILW